MKKYRLHVWNSILKNLEIQYNIVSKKEREKK